MTLDVVFRARRIITPAGEVAGDVGVRDGTIVAVAPSLDAPQVVELADDEVLLPGLVDTHVHVNDPGRAEWEGFETATRAAAAGGVTTIVDMPLNSVPPTVDVPSLVAKQDTARDRVHIDVGFWGGAVPGNLDHLGPLHDAGVFGFKCFLLDSGVEEFGHLSAAEVEAVLRRLRELDAVLIVHAEDPAHIEPTPSSTRYQDFLASRPPRAEYVAIATVLDLARRTGTRVHVLHLSAAETIPLIAAARRDGVAVTAETCPHYLMLTAEEIPAGATEFKCCPPIRPAANQDALWQGLAYGVIDCVVSDHSPSTADLKVPDFGRAWGGIAGLQLGLPAVWTAARARGVPLAEVVGWLATKPAALAGLHRKGAIEAGRDADLCVLAPAEEFTVDVAKLSHRNKVSAYHGKRLTGVVRRTYLRGRAVDGVTPRGRLLSRGES